MRFRSYVFDITNAHPLAVYSWRDDRAGTVSSSEAGVSSFTTNAPASINVPGDRSMLYEYQVFGELNGCSSQSILFDVMIGGSPELGIELQELGIEGNLGVTEDIESDLCRRGSRGIGE